MSDVGNNLIKAGCGLTVLVWVVIPVLFILFAVMCGSVE